MNDKLLCPVCNLQFNNKYCLSNHFYNRGNGKFLDDDHKIYWFENKSKLKKAHEVELLTKIRQNKCIRCGSIFSIDFEHRFQKRCQICNEKYPRRKKRKNEVYKSYPCSKCGKIIEVRLCSSNTICNECKEKTKHEKIKCKLERPLVSKCIRCGRQIIKFKKHIHDNIANRICDNCKNDKEWFKKHVKYNEVIELLRTTNLTRYEICSILDLDYDFVREAAIDKFGNEWYNSRLKMIDKQAGYKISKAKKSFFDNLRLDKTKFDDYFKKRNVSFNPSSVEKQFVEQISCCLANIETNKWLTIQIDGRFEHREIDVKVSLGNHKFAVFIDGEAFHGKNAKSCFKTPTIEHDSLVAIAFANMGYFSIRYSESEVKSGEASNHFLQKYKEFQNSLPTFYYRNWMTNDEVIEF